MSVTQFVDHVREDFEQVFIGHRRGDAAGIAFVHLVPVEPVDFVLVVQETVLLVDDAPERLKVGLRCISGNIFPDA